MVTIWPSHPTCLPKLPNKLQNELMVFLTINSNRDISFKQAVKLSQLPKSTFASALERLKLKGVIANTSKKGKKANYAFDDVALKAFLDEISVHFCSVKKSYNKSKLESKKALEKDYAKRVSLGFTKISPERLNREVKRRVKKELVTTSCSLELDKLPQNIDYLKLGDWYYRRDSNESDLSFWNRKLIEAKMYPQLQGYFFSERQIRQKIGKYTKLIASANESRLLKETARRRVKEE